MRIDDRLSEPARRQETTRSRSSMKGKSRNRNARMDLVRRDAANARRRARKYDRRQYDKPVREDAP